MPGRRLSGSAAFNRRHKLLEQQAQIQSLADYQINKSTS